ncbi:MAG: hypothetical protein ACI3VB_04145 [Oscillospiraceae bacterium]
MMETIRSWILCITGTALVCSAAMALTPEGMAKKAVRLICGLALMIALMGIAVKLDYGSLSLYMSEYRQKAEDTVSDAVSESSKQTRYIIEKECEAYILDKAETIGIGLYEVSVTAKWSEDGYWYPASAKMTSEPDEEKSRELALKISAELGIPEEAQIWSTKDED